jgi:hypothetical protein
MPLSAQLQYVDCTIVDYDAYVSSVICLMLNVWEFCILSSPIAALKLLNLKAKKSNFTQISGPLTSSAQQFNFTEVNPHSIASTWPSLPEEYFVTCIFDDAFTWRCLWQKLLLVSGIWSGWDPVLGWELEPGAAARLTNRSHTWHHFRIWNSFVHALQVQPICLWTC